MKKLINYKILQVKTVNLQLTMAWPKENTVKNYPDPNKYLNSPLNTLPHPPHLEMSLYLSTKAIYIEMYTKIYNKLFTLIYNSGNIATTFS